MADWVCLHARHPCVHAAELLPLARQVYAAAGAFLLGRVPFILSKCMLLLAVPACKGQLGSLKMQWHAAAASEC
eukprot:scaffold47099_cov23-Tisochrysis_lutea.AAC.1